MDTHTMPFEHYGVTYTLEYVFYPDTGDGTPEMLDLKRILVDGHDVGHTVRDPVQSLMAKAAARHARANGGVFQGALRQSAHPAQQPPRPPAKAGSRP